jgi:hypothetical protein
MSCAISLAPCGLTIDRIEAGPDSLLIQGLVEDTPENHPQADVAFRPGGVREGKPLRTAAAVFYLIENIPLLGTVGGAISGRSGEPRRHRHGRPSL